MKNKNAKADGKTIVIILVALALIAGIWYFSQSSVGTVTQHAQTPADISQGSSGTGLKLRLFDNNGNPIPVPSWFTSQTGAIVPNGPFAIVKSPSPASCSVASNCAGYTAGGAITCWNSQCVLANIGAIALDFGVTNTGQAPINNVGITSATLPAAFYNAANKTLVNLAPGAGFTFTMPGSMSITGNGWVGTNQTFSITVQGTNSYNGATVTATDSYTLGFYADPSGSLSVSLVKVV